MSFSHLHDTLRTELLRRIKRGVLSVSMLARQTELSRPHLSGFLRGHKRLSMVAADRALNAQRLTTADLEPTNERYQSVPVAEFGMVPLVTPKAALTERIIQPGSTLRKLHFPNYLLESFNSRPAKSERNVWQRFVAVQVSEKDAIAMSPYLMSNTIALIDRHYTSFAQYQPDGPNRQDHPNLYAVNRREHVVVRHATFTAGRLVLEAQNKDIRPELLEPTPKEEPEDLLVGRVAMTMNVT
jgi:hypothetical protein